MATVTITVLSCKGIQRDKDHLETEILLFVLCWGVDHTFRLGRSCAHTQISACRGSSPLLSQAIPGFSRAACSLH